MPSSAAAEGVFLRWLLSALLVLLLLLQYRLWFADGSLAERQRLAQQMQQAQRENSVLRTRNEQLAREVLDLQRGHVVVEQRAREELGLIRDDEVFYHFVEAPVPTTEAARVRQ